MGGGRRGRLGLILLLQSDIIITITKPLIEIDIELVAGKFTAFVQKYTHSACFSFAHQLLQDRGIKGDS